MSVRVRSAGFTLIELMITLVIMAIVITVGVPSFNDFIAAQRVRVAASDLIADMAFARAEAIKESRLVVMEPMGGAGNWQTGWRIWVDLDGDGAMGANETRKIGGPVTGRTAVCSAADLGNGIVFRPDGRAAFPNVTLDSLAPVRDNDGIKVSDDMGDTDAGNDRVRTVLIGISGRPSVAIQDAGTAFARPPCPTFP